MQDVARQLGFADLHALEIGLAANSADWNMIALHQRHLLHSSDQQRPLKAALNGEDAIDEIATLKDENASLQRNIDALRVAPVSACFPIVPAGRSQITVKTEPRTFRFADASTARATRNKSPEHRRVMLLCDACFH